MAYNDFVALVREKTKKNTTAAETSAAVGNSAVDRMVDYMKYQRIGFDKLGEDINALVSGAQGYLEGGWADGNATAAQKQSVSSMISRLKSAKQYYTNHPEQFSGDVSKSIEEIDRTLGSLTELSGYIDKAGAGYANYSSREEYDKAISDYTFTSQYKDMSADELEHIVSDLKFLKWGHDMNGNGFALHGVNQDNYGERIAHLESLLAEKQVGNYVEWAKQQGDFTKNASYIDPGKEYKDAKDLEKVYMLLANPTLAYSENVLADKGYNPFDLTNPYEKLVGIFQAVGQTAEAGKMLEMSADERKTFYYLYNTGQTEQAEKYINALTDISGKRLSEDVNSFVTNMAAEHPWLSTIAAIGTDIVISLPNTIETIANAVVGGKYDRYSGFNILGGATDTIYSTVPRVWAEKYGWDKDMTSFIYSTGVSIAQNVGTSLLFGGYGGTKIGKIASLAAMGTQASGSTMRKLAEQGAQDWQIYTLGAISGVAEVALEKVPLDKLIKIGKEGGKAGLKATLKNIVNQISTEFTEEAATEIVNILADSIVRLNESELATAVSEKGLLAALKDSIGQVIMAGASGAVSGGFMGSVFSIYGGTVGSEQYRPVGKFIVDNGAASTLIEQGLKLGQGSEAYEIAELLKRRMTNNREGKLNAMSYADVGRLYALETAAVRQQYMQATENKLSVKLEAAGVKASKAEGLAAALAKAISGEQMTRAETKAIGKSAQAMQILEQSRAMLDPSRVAFNPIQKSTTYGIADGAMVITRLGNSNMYRVDLLPSANAERAASTGEIGDGAVRTLESQSVRQVEQMIKKAAEGAGIADISSGFGEQLSSDEAAAMTMLSAEMSGVNENVAGIAAGIAGAMGGDLRIVFDPELSKTGDTGIYRKNYDGTREAQIAPTLGGVVSTLAHELFHDIEDTAAGKAFIAAAVEYAKTLPAKNPDNGANRYEEVKHLYQTRKGVSDKAELETEVGAKIAGDILASEDALGAVLEHMKPQQKASLWQRLKRALTSLRNKLKGQKNAKPAETQLNVLERLYKQAFAQRVIQDAVENPRVGDPNAVSESDGKGVTRMNEEKTQISSEKEKASIKEIVGDSGTKYGIGVYLDSTLLTGLTDDERVEMVKEYIKELGGTIFTAYDNDNNAVSVLLAEPSRKFKNKSGRRVSVTKDLSSYLNNTIKQEAIVLIDELISASSYKGPEPTTHPHDWVDNNGANDWDVWTTYVQDKENTVWEAKLRIANSANGEKILYDIFPIEMVEQSGTSDTSTTDNSIPQNQDLSTGKSEIAEKNAQKAVFGSEKADVAEDDAAYMAAVKRGDMETAQRMVDEAAKAWGAITNGNTRVPKPLHLYHGTGSFGFTRFRDGNIYATVSEAVAAGYNHGRGLGRVRSSSLGYIRNDGTVETAIKNAKNVLGATFTKLDDSAKQNIINKADNIFKDVANKVAELDESTDYEKAAELFEYLTEKYGEDKSIQWTNHLDNLHYMLTGEYTAAEIIENGEWLAHDIEKYHEWKQSLSELWSEEQEAIKDSTLDKVFRYLLGYEYGDALIDIEYGLGRLLDDRQKLVNLNGNLVYLDDIVEDIEMAKDTGIYDLYGHPSEKPLIIDEGKRFWDAIPFENGFRSTDYIVKWAKEKGYTSVLFKTVLDPSSGGSANIYADEWVFFNSKQVKSADPVTYDDNGNVIPLSKRFNMKDPDIRYEIAEDEIPNSSQKTIDDALYEAQEQSVKTWGKKDVEKLKMKATLARNGNVYSTAEVSKYVAKALRVISPSIVATVDGLGRTFDNVRTTAEAKKLVAAALTNVFNRNTSEKHRRQICEDCAAYLIANTFADDVTFAEDLEARQAQSYAAINVLERYRGKLNVDPGDVERVKKRIASKWLVPQVGATVGKGHSVFEVLNELAAVGVEIKLDGETWAELDVLNALDDLYSKSLETIGEDMKVSIGSPAEYKAYIDSVAESLYQAYEESGKPSEVKRINTDKNLEIAALLAEQDEALESERERFKDKFKDKVKEIRDREYEKRKKMRSEMIADKNLEIAALQAEHEKAIDNITLYAEIQKMIAAVKEFPKRKVKIGSLISPEWENIVKAAGKIIPQKFISPAGATDFADTFIKFLAVHAPTLLDYGKTYVEILGEAGDLFGDKRLKAAADKVNKLNEEAQTSSIPEDGKAEPAEDLEIYKLISKETAADVMWLSLRNRMYEDQQIEYELNRAEKKAQREGRELSNAEAEEIRKNAVSKAKNIAFTPGELEVLRDIIKAVIRINKRYNQSYIDGRWQDTDKYSTLAISESNEYHGYAGTDATSKLKTAQLNAMTPQGVAAYAGGFAENGSVLEKLVKDLVIAETKKTRKLAQYLAEGVEFYEAKEHKKWRKHYNDDRINLEFDTVDAEGKPIKKNVVMTVGQAMALMCSTKRKQAELALSLSDIIFVGLEKRGKDVEKERTYERATIDDNITEKDLRTLAERQFLELKQKLSKIYTEQFSEEDKQFMKIVEKFFELSGDEKSATDILLTGTTNVIGGYYFPIIRSKWGRDLNLIGNDNQFGLITMTGLPFNHNTIENAKAPMFIMDIWDLFRKYANDLALYTTLTIPLQTLNRVYNCKVDIPGIKEKTLREYLEKHAWSGISGYLRDLMIQVQGNVSGTSLDATTAKVLNYLKSAHAKYALGFNVQTYLKQKTTEFAVMSSAPFSAWLKGMMWRPSAVDRDGAGKKRTDVFDLEGKMAQMRKYSEVAYIRQDRTELLRAYGALGALGRVGDWTMKMVGRGDDIATLRIFSIAQYAAEKQSGYAVGTVENLKLAGQLADEWINEYNDTSAITTKSAFARSGNMLWSALTMYSSATVKAFTRLTVKAGRVDALKVREKNSNVKPSKEAIKKAKNEFLKEVGVYVVSSVVLVALIEQLMRALRGQDEPKDNLKGWIEGMVGNELPPVLNELYDMTVAAIDVIPVVGTVIENLIGGYDTTSFAFDIVNGARDLVYSIGDVSLAVRNDEDVHWSGVIIKAVDNIGQALGLPTRNIRNIASCCVGLYSMISGDTVPRYKFDSLVYKPNYSEDLNAAINAGDERLAETVADMLMVDRVGSSVGSEAAGEIVSLYASGETGVLPSKIGSKITVSINDESREIELTAAEQRELRAEYGKATGAVRRMVSTSAYSRLTTAERAVAVRDMNRLYMDRAKAKLHGADMTTAVAMTCLMSEGKYICAYAHIKAIKADKTVKNKATQIKRWLRSQGLSVAEQRAILYASGYRSEENLAAVKRLLRSASLSAKEKAAVRAALSIE